MKMKKSELVLKQMKINSPIREMVPSNSKFFGGSMVSGSTYYQARENLPRKTLLGTISRNATNKRPL
jgi:hypothetical protein